MHSKNGKVRIIAGEWRGRKLQVPPGVRPTPDRVRETLFNWLATHIPASRCLDLFAGSGALGIEAASRGARSVMLVEQVQNTVQNLNRQLALLSTDKVTVTRENALQFLQKSPSTFDIVFLDPPFASNLLSPCCDLLEERGWLDNHAFIYIEMSRHLQIPPLPATWQIIRQQAAGQVIGLLAQRSVQAETTISKR